MEVTVTQENLDFAVSSANRVASSKAGLPILSNILFRTDSSRLVVAATNLELSSSHTVPAKVSKPGSITIPAKLLSDVVHNLPKDSVTLSVTDTKLKITTSSTSSTINGMSDEEFPELPIIDESDDVISYTLTADDLKHAVSQTIVSASSDSTRPVLTGVYWHSHDGALFLAATDGYRLAERRLIETKSDIHAIIPVSTLQEVMRTLKDDTPELDILFSETQVTFKVGTVELASRLIDGTFPDYRQLIPAQSETSMTLSRTEFVRAIRIASLFAREAGGGITLAADAEQERFTIASIASEVGENASQLSTEINGEPGSVSLNSRYLLDALSVMSAEQITFGFSGKLSPCVLQEVSKEQSYKHIVMPLKS